MEKEEIVGRINDLISYMHLTKSGFALRCGMDRGMVGRILSGEQRITIRTIDRICAAFPEVNRDWLLNGVGTMLKSVVIHQAGDNNTAAGSHSVINNSDTLALAISELAAQRKVTEKAQEQIDRLISLLERKQLK